MREFLPQWLKFFVPGRRLQVTFMLVTVYEIHFWSNNSSPFKLSLSLSLYLSLSLSLTHSCSHFAAKIRIPVNKTQMACFRVIYLSISTVPPEKKLAFCFDFQAK